MSKKRKKSKQTEVSTATTNRDGCSNVLSVASISSIPLLNIDILIYVYVKGDENRTEQKN